MWKTANKAIVLVEDTKQMDANATFEEMHT
jgi:hypothetical protein